MKETYYISLDSYRMDKEKLDEHYNYFEVKADGKDLEELERLLNQLSSMDKDATSIFLHPHSEKENDQERNVYQDTLYTLYEKIYEVGTEDTKSNIQALDILNFTSNR